MFNNADNKRLSYEALQSQTRKLCEAEEVEDHSEHVFSHIFA
jgi:hypothetical protein